MPEQPPDIFRAEARAWHEQRQGPRATLPEEAPAWTRWGYLALLVLCAAFAAGLFLRVEVQPLPSDAGGPRRERLIDLLLSPPRPDSVHAGH